ncbi:MAG: VacJ family lipoprotein [Gammaproteobacteria bacterium]
MTIRGPAAVALICAASLLANGCASSDAARTDAGDPFEPINRGIFAFNDVADTYVLRPIAVGYQWLLPGVARTGINNFFDNISYPVDIANALLQGKFRQAASDSARLGINTTLGLAGLLDPATGIGLPRHNEDFGQTLGVWGVPDGPYLVVPIFGPRTVRSGTGDLVDIQYNPQFNLGSSSVRTKANLGWLIHQRSTLLGVDQEINRAYDRYAFLRDSYLQNRRYLRYDGNPPEEDLFLDEEFEDESWDE